MERLGLNNREHIGQEGARRGVPLFLLVVSFLLIVFSLYGARASVFEKARETILDVSTPVLSFFNAPIKWVDDRVGNITDYFNVLDQNKKLREENAALLNWQHEAKTLRQQVTYFERVLDMKLPLSPDYIDAYAVGETNGPYQSAMIISAGRKDNVAVGDAVIDDFGLVGHVVSTGARAARVLLLTDFNSQLPVFIETAELEAILAGRYQNKPFLKFMRNAEAERIAPGMRVVTSGAGGVMPRGIPVGTVDRIKIDENLEEYQIFIQLYSNYNKTDRVRVVDFSFPSITTPAETSDPLLDTEETQSPAPLPTEGG